MNGLAWTVAELFIYAVDIAGALWYLNKKLGEGKRSPTGILIGFVSLFALITACYFLSAKDYVRLPLMAAGAIAYAAVAYRGNVRQCIFHAIMPLFLVAVSDVLVIALITLLPGVTFNMVLQQTIYRVQAMIASKMLYLFLIFVFGKGRSSTVGKGTYWLMVLSLPAISLGMLGALIQYESVVNGSSSYEIVAVSFGIFAMNVILLMLHNRLAVSTRLLVEKEKMLELAELENRHVNDTLAAYNSLRGFRHDLKNHLQVLSGLMEMNNVQKAREYLGEIGSFVTNSEIMVNCGNPLIDAVLGGKLASARKLGIELVHTVSLSREIGMEPIDLCSLLGNVMDNAIEACVRMRGAQGPKRIEFCLHDAGGDIRLSVVNTMDSAEAGKKRAFRLPKARDSHGIGLANVRKIVQKYSGSLLIDQAGGEFKLRIVIPISAGRRPPAEAAPHSSCS